MGHNGSENFKTLLLLQIAATSFQTCPKISSYLSSPNHAGDVLNFEFPIVNIFFFENFKFTIVLYREIKNLNYLENERSQGKTG